ncbi:MAG: hypothetical protein H7202_08990 [Pedobacter sp.]|nr:hypothetical protein [Pedobacter sp.]
MNDAHLHLILNHLPIIIPVIGLLIMVGGLIIKSELLKRTAYFVFMLAALTAIPTFATGEGAEEVIEKLAGVDENLIKTHEEIAEKFAILCYVLGGISLLGLWANFYKKSLSTIISYITILICIVTLYYAKQTGTTGGEIKHIEIR